jgi:hypothetical protein
MHLKNKLKKPVVTFASGGQGESAWRMALCAQRIPEPRETSAKTFY